MKCSFWGHRDATKNSGTLRPVWPLRVVVEKRMETEIETDQEIYTYTLVVGGEIERGEM